MKPRSGEWSFIRRQTDTSAQGGPVLGGKPGETWRLCFCISIVTGWEWETWSDGYADGDRSMDSIYWNPEVMQALCGTTERCSG